MNETLRQKKLLDYLASHHYICTNDYIDMLGISLSTARRDITKLATQGKLLKIRNGAQALSGSSGSISTLMAPQFIPLAPDINNYAAKTRIAQAAAQLCEENDSIIISGSNTTFLMAEHLAGRHVQIITNFIPLAYQLIMANHPGLIILGGQYLPERQITLSPDHQPVDDHASRFVFFTGSGVSKAGVHTSDLLVYMAEKRLLEYGDKRVALVDSSKVGKPGGKLLATVTQLDTLITDQGADAATVEYLLSVGVNVITV